jgi:hypothetical protein
VLPEPTQTGPKKKKKKKKKKKNFCVFGENILSIEHVTKLILTCLVVNDPYREIHGTKSVDFSGLERPI